MKYLDLLKEQFNNRLGFVEKRPGTTQLIAPLYHEDGDMVDIFLEDSPAGGDRIRICDHGLTLMRLSYSYDLNTPRKEQVLQRILSENQVNEEQGNLFMDVEPQSLYPSVLQFAQVVSKVAGMRLYKREVIQSLFFEILKEIVEERLRKYSPQSPFYPIPDGPEYEVDYCFNHSPRPIYLFGVNSSKASHLATISCLKFQTANLSFRSAVVLESLDVITRKDQARLMSAADKHFPSLDDFREHGERFLERELLSQ